jgi:glycosyltransferase involved in cell wall biosynthesis
MITIAILAKNKSATLPLYLHCLEKQTFPKNKINLYIRTNDNTDNTEDILKEYIVKYRDEYNNIYYDDSSIDDKLKLIGNHDWNVLDLKY